MNFFDKYIEKDKPGLSSIHFPSQEYCRKSKIKKTKADDEDLSGMSLKEGKGLKILAPNKLLTRLPML